MILFYLTILPPPECDKALAARVIITAICHQISGLAEVLVLGSFLLLLAFTEMSSALFFPKECKNRIPIWHSSASLTSIQEENTLPVHKAFLQQSNGPYCPIQELLITGLYWTAVPGQLLMTITESKHTISCNPFRNPAYDHFDSPPQPISDKQGCNHCKDANPNQSAPLHTIHHGSLARRTVTIKILLSTMYSRQKHWCEFTPACSYMSQLPLLSNQVIVSFQ